MKLWGGRFTKEENQLVHNFNESLSFDQKFYKQDIQGSLAHVKMLGKQGIITTDEMNDIIKGLESIRVDLDNGTLQFDNSEDIHSFVEAHLIERIGDAGKKLHTGRSLSLIHISLIFLQWINLLKLIYPSNYQEIYPL